ncbi:hypothetical protein BDN71DRAFT_196691 [Pleurotus eryngii]|uniref:F-box domain-containing protein n=1 Tax=Pleurotus eryngii TaxID=5323 RepID=A0A9P5ZR94_PLEER|nr:hypothetical protein BDN71DRAFT_196691 [Pleurotus eryngii]
MQPMTSTSASNRLPAELWRDIFRNALGDEFFDQAEMSSDYRPFESTGECRPRTSRPISLAISQVCVQWNLVMLEFFRRTGQRSRPTVGHFVRCIEIPPFEINSVLDDPCSIYDILACCPSVKLIVKATLGRHGDEPFWTTLARPSPSVDNLFLSHLERIDWSSRFGRPRYVEHLEVVYPILRTIILQAPNLRYLSINDWKEHMFDDIPLPVLFPSLETLRLRGATGFLSAGVRPSDLPKLSNFIAEPMNMSYRFNTEEPEILHVLGDKIRRLELDGSPAGSEFTYMGVADILMSSPALEELNFQPGAPPLILHESNAPHEALKTLRIYADAARHRRLGYNGIERFQQLMTAALEMFLAEEQFPYLSRLVVYGDIDIASSFISQSQFILEAVNTGRISLELV